jgi:thioredoxin-related protein|tara:strand:+ start:8657 stop:9025 length:369 start_codon:yes stop_codon:yes gene_type:complete
MALRLLLLFAFFLTSCCLGQAIVNENEFNEKLNEDIVVVEFYAEWNKDNMVDLKEFKDVKTYTINIEDTPSLVAKYKVLSVPTLIVFNNKEVVEKYEADLTFQLCIKQAKKRVEELVLKKFM